MFWFRFFGSRVRDNNAQSHFTFCKTSDHDRSKLDFLGSCNFVFNDSEDSSQDVPVTKCGGGRRSAIDLTRTGDSVDIGPQAVIRFSLDMFSDPSYQLASLLKGYSQITTSHRGGHARILRALSKSSGEAVAFKLYEKRNMSPSQLDCAWKELEILRKGFGRGVTQLLDAFEDERLMLFTMEEYSKGSLMAVMYDYGGSLTEEACVKLLARPLVQVLDKLHDNDIIHRNIKPEHILYDSNLNLYLCDFRGAVIKGRDTFTDREGTLAYMAPEMLAKPTPEEIFHIVLTHGVDESDLPNYNEKVDVWSMGVVIVEALTGLLPFVSDSPDGMTKVLADHFSGSKHSYPLHQIESSAKFSSEVKDFLEKIFRMDPNDRATIGDLYHHPWLQIVD